MTYLLLKSDKKKFSPFLRREIFEKNQSGYFKKRNTPFCSEFDADFKYIYKYTYVSRKVAKNI